MCVSEEEQKNKLYNLLIQLKLKRQHEKNIFIDSHKDKIAKSQENHIKTLENILDINKMQVGSIYEAGKNSNDCYMIVLKDWSPCNLICGGGESFLQLLKVNAKQGGVDCYNKETILKRRCNTQPCPSVKQIENINHEIKRLDNINLLKEMEVKSVQISQRPQRFDKCHLKDADALMEKNEGVSKKTNEEHTLIPIRLVMNDKTITAYQDDNLKNKIITFLLEETNIEKTNDVRKCFLVKNNVTTSKFCMIDATKGDFVEEWLNDYKLFKNGCVKNIQNNKSLKTEENKLEKEYNMKIEKIKLELVQNKVEVVKKSFEIEEKKKLEKKINEFRKMSFSALEKELRLEQLLEKEEESREQTESSQLEQQISQEKNKEDSLNKAIKEKELENQFNIAKVQAQKAIEDIKKNTQAQILKQRQIIAKKIIEMRQKRKRKNAELKNQILKIRSNIADKLKNINKEGDKSECLNTKNIETYCIKNFSENFIKLADCKTKESFCYVCCEHEFGELHVLTRDQCYSECDKNEKSS